MPRQKENTRRGALNLLGINASDGIPAAERVIEIPVSSVYPNPYQPRRQFPQESLTDLADSIKAHGLQQPIIVRLRKQSAVTDGSSLGQTYELIVGERRLRAHNISGFKVIRAIVRVIEDEQLLRLSIVENIHREDISFMDRAIAFCRFKNQFHAGKVESAAADLKISRRNGFNYSKIGSAEPNYQALIVKNNLDVRSSNLLLNLANKVAKKLPKKTETFKKAINNNTISLPTLNQLQNKYFPATVEKNGKPNSIKEKKHTPIAATVENSLFRKTDIEVVLELRFDPRKTPPINTKLRGQWIKAAKQFFKAAGFTAIEIK